mmetsp:Transcript_37921/g.96295  ORF Transcript_37921/g.96295 Transcript_37921/m.96295 type:complete len:305 (+) Transcript_37921:267-1181(+)
MQSARKANSPASWLAGRLVLIVIDIAVLPHSRAPRLGYALLFLQRLQQRQSALGGSLLDASESRRDKLLVEIGLRVHEERHVEHTRLTVFYTREQLLAPRGVAEGDGRVIPVRVVGRVGNDEVRKAALESLGRDGLGAQRRIQRPELVVGGDVLVTVIDKEDFDLVVLALQHLGAVPAIVFGELGHAHAARPRLELVTKVVVLEAAGCQLLLERGDLLVARGVAVKVGAIADLHHFQIEDLLLGIGDRLLLRGGASSGCGSRLCLLQLGEVLPDLEAGLLCALLGCRQLERVGAAIRGRRDALR